MSEEDRAAYRALVHHLAYWQCQAEWAAKQLEWHLKQVEYFTGESRLCREEIEKLQKALGVWKEE
jgi:hypothetical protein